MIVAVIGGRNFTKFFRMRLALDKFRESHSVSMIVSGGAKGADELAYRYAVLRGITFVCHPPIPEDGSPRKYYRRNVRIANHAEAVLAFPTKYSRGTWHTIRKAKNLGKPVWVYNGKELVKE